ncbi:hypothetical protein HRbin26_01218 [bacterium HR26]|nr:hypothetical protein HRbin26_01218 [bacterium HR26]
MPLYEFTCPAHGPFELRRPFSQASAPAHCPRCGELARRVFTSPNVPRTPAWIVEGLTREERSRHEPRIATREEIGLPAYDPEAKPQYHVARGRPWMISH